MRKVEIHDVGIPVVRPPIVGWPSSKASKPVPPVPGEGPYLLLEDGSRVLTEDGSGTLLEIGGGG